MKKNLWVGVAAVVAIVASIALILRKAPREPLPADQAISAGIAEEATRQLVKLVGKNGKIIVIADGQANRYLFRGFQPVFAQALKKAGLNIIAVEKIPLPSQGDLYLPADVYTRVVQANPGVNAIVSLVGLPRGSEPSPRRPKLAVIAGEVKAEDARRAIAEKVADLVIAQRGDDLGRKMVPRTPQEWFQAMYQVYTP
jgi:hypothetical protein